MNGMINMKSHLASRMGYLIQRLLWLLPTLFLILCVNFAIVQAAPGGPVDQAVSRAKLLMAHQGQEVIAPDTGSVDAQMTLSPELMAQIRQQYGFDQPWYVRFGHMLWQYAHFDLGQSFFRGQSVTHLIIDKLPVTISLGLWSMLLVYLISIPLGIRKAEVHGSRFDRATGLILAVTYAIPVFVLAVLLVMLFAGGVYWHWFPLQGMVSNDFASFSVMGKLRDYIWHMSLPWLVMILSSLAWHTYLVKFAVLDESHKPYVTTARAKGLSEQQVLYGHVLRNALLVLIVGLPDALLGMFLLGNFLIEIIFNLDGLGLLGYDALMQRDYPVIFGILLVYSLVRLVLRLISDLLYLWIDPRMSYAGGGH